MIVLRARVVMVIPVSATPQRVLVTANMTKETEKADMVPNTALATKDTRIMGFRPNLQQERKGKESEFLQQSSLSECLPQNTEVQSSLSPKNDFNH